MINEMQRGHAARAVDSLKSGYAKDYWFNGRVIKLAARSDGQFSFGTWGDGSSAFDGEPMDREAAIDEMAHRLYCSPVPADCPW